MPLDPALRSDLARLAAGEHGDPFAVLGLHRDGEGDCVRVFRPDAEAVRLRIGARDVDLAPQGEGLFAGAAPPAARAEGYRLAIRLRTGETRLEEDPYRFGLVIAPESATALKAGRCWSAQEVLGAHAMSLEGVEGVAFAVWAPLARGVALLGDWLGWNGLLRPMRFRHEIGVWEFFEPGLAPGAAYAFEIFTADRRRLVRRDPYARAILGDVAARVTEPPAGLLDPSWRAARAARADRERAILAVRGADWGFDEDAPLAARRLVRAAADLGFTDLRLLDAIGEARFAAAPGWGGESALAALVREAHASRLGVFADCALATAPDALAAFDGSPLYEPAEPERAREADGGLRFNYARYEAANFLVCSALHLIEAFEIDGLFLSGVARALHTPPSGDIDGAAVDFIRTLTELIAARAPGVAIVAADGAGWPGLRQPTAHGGLGFDWAEEPGLAQLLGGPGGRRLGLTALGARPGWLDARRVRDLGLGGPRARELGALLVGVAPGAACWSDPAVGGEALDWLRDTGGEAARLRALLSAVHGARLAGPAGEAVVIEGPAGALAFSRGQGHICLLNFSEQDAEMTVSAPAGGLFQPLAATFEGAPVWLEAGADARAPSGFVLRARLPARSGMLAHRAEPAGPPC